MKTIALFGGSFDPPHVGHLAIVNALRSLDFIDEVVIMPTFLNPFKSSFYAPGELRLQWLKEMFNDAKNVVVSNFEITQNSATPTIKSVNYLLKKYAKIYLVIGADNLASLKQWHNYEELISKVTFIVAPRDGIFIPKDFLVLNVDENISSTQIRKGEKQHSLSHTCAVEIEKFYKDLNERNS